VAQGGGGVHGRRVTGRAPGDMDIIGYWRASMIGGIVEEVLSATMKLYAA
jgi:hypothetical protein